MIQYADNHPINGRMFLYFILNQTKLTHQSLARLCRRRNATNHIFKYLKHILFLQQFMNHDAGSYTLQTTI